MAVQPKLPGMAGPKSEGAMRGSGAPEKFDKEFTPFPEGIKGMDSLHDDIGEKSGFETSGYLDKKGTPYGEAAKLNFLPPGMDITKQEMTDQRDMPLKKVVAESYAGDGWEPAPRDIPE